MKTIKYTAVALALIASASFTTSAKAAASQGDLLLGIYDSSGTVTTDYVVDLGGYNTLSAGETFNLGSAINTLFGGTPSATLVFDITGIGYSSSNTSPGGLGKKQWAFTATNLPGTLPPNNTSETTNISGAYAGFNSVQSTVLTGGTSSSGVAFQVVTQPISGNTQAFANESTLAGGGFGVGTDITTPYSTTASVPFYTLTSGASSITSDPTGFPGGDFFTFSGTPTNVTLTFDAVPEPSAYALGLCAVGLFWVLNRRRSVA